MIFERNCLLGVLVAALLAPLLFQNQYALHIGVLIMFSVMLATSFNLIVGYVGEFPLGHTAFLGVGAYTAALFSTRLAMPFHVAVLAAPLVAAVFGLVIGAITLRLRGPFFVIVTLCFAEVLRLIANNWIDLTNGPMGNIRHRKAGMGDRGRRAAAEDGLLLYRRTAGGGVPIRVLSLRVFEHRSRRHRGSREPFRGAVDRRFAVLCRAHHVRAGSRHRRSRGRLLRQLRLLCRSRSIWFLLHDFDDHHGAGRRQGNADRPGGRRRHRRAAGRVFARLQGAALFDLRPDRDGRGAVPAARHHGIYRPAPRNLSSWSDRRCLNSAASRSGLAVWLPCPISASR